MKILITGGAGFIGSYTTDLLISKNYNVFVLDSLHSKTHNNEWPDYINNKAIYIKGDVLDKDLLNSILSKVDAIIHLAAEMDLNPDFQKFMKSWDFRKLAKPKLDAIIAFTLDSYQNN